MTFGMHLGSLGAKLTKLQKKTGCSFHGNVVSNDL